jgi:hypothetical protein
MTEAVGFSETSVTITHDYTFEHGCWLTSISIVSDYGPDNRAIGVRFPGEAEVISSSLCVQTGSWTHPTTYPSGTWGPFLGG